MKKIASIVLLIAFALLPLRASSFFAVLPDGRTISPAGFTDFVSAFPSQLALSPDGNYVAVLAQDALSGDVEVFSASDGSIVQRLTIPTPGRLLWTSGALYVSSNPIDSTDHGYTQKGVIARFVYTPNPQPYEPPSLKSESSFSAGSSIINGLAEDAALHRLYVAHTDGREIIAIDEITGKTIAHLPTNGQPFALALNHGTLFATLYNTGSIDVWPNVEAASTGRVSISAVNISTGPHPTELLSSGDRVYVANADGHTVTVIDAPTHRIIRNIELAANPHEPPGRTPAGMALSLDGRELFVAESGMNDIAVVNLSTNRIVKHIPTAWYPISVVAAPLITDVPTIPGEARNTAGERTKTSRTALWIANAKGYGSQADPAGEWDGIYAGVVQHVAADAKPGGEYAPAAAAYQRPALLSANELPPIKHIVFIVKENKHFDEEFGDFPGTDHDPKLVLYGRKYTPNAHALASRYTIFDRFMSNGEGSIFGHSWTTQGWTNDYQERNARLQGDLPVSIWPFTIPIDAAPMSVEDTVWFQDLSQLPPSPPRINTSAVFGPRGELINELQRKHVSFRVYGEQMTLLPDGRIAPGLAAHADRAYPGTHIDFNILDTQRAKLFLSDVKQHGLAAYSYMTLPTDHTAGVSPGLYYPESYIADNDLALGQIIAGLSKRPEWQSTVVIVTMDDPQGTGDHYNDHRMPAFMIGPYVRRHFVSHARYDQASVLRTVEVLFHLDPLSIYDAFATPMLDALARQPDDIAYRALPAEIPILRVPGKAEETSFDLDGPRWRDLPSEEWLELKGSQSLAMHNAYLASLEHTTYAIGAAALGPNASPDDDDDE